MNYKIVILNGYIMKNVFLRVILIIYILYDRISYERNDSFRISDWRKVICIYRYNCIGVKKSRVNLKFWSYRLNGVF